MESVRVLIKIAKGSSFYETALVDHDNTISEAIAILGEQGIISSNSHSDASLFTALAIDRYGSRILFVFDICNSAYNFDEAHLDGKNNLPVISMSLSRNGHIDSTAHQLIS